MQAIQTPIKFNKRWNIFNWLEYKHRICYSFTAIDPSSVDLHSKKFPPDTGYAPTTTCTPGRVHALTPINKTLTPINDRNNHTPIRGNSGDGDDEYEQDFEMDDRRN